MILPAVRLRWDRNTSKLFSSAFLALAFLLGGCATAPTPSPEEAGAAKLHLKRGLEMVKAGGHAAEAEAEFRQALKLNPSDAESVTQLAVLLAQQPQRIKEAVRLFERAAVLEPNNWVRWAALSTVCFFTEDWDGAVSAATRAIELQPGGSRPYYARGMAWRMKGDVDAAVRDFREAARLEPTSAENVFMLGYMLGQKDEVDDAIAALSRCIELDPLRADAYIRRGDLWRRKEKYDEAQWDIIQGLGLDPQNAMGWSGLGDVLMALERAPKAIPAYSRAMELDPGFMFHVFDRGKARLDAGDLDGAIADFDQALRIAPQSEAAYYRRALARARKGDFAGAESDLSAAIRLDPNDDINWRQRGVFRFVQGDYRGALADLKESHRRSEDHQPYDQFLCYLLQRRLGKSGDADILRKIAQTDSDPWVQAIARFLAEEITEVQLFALAAGEGKEAAGRQCEANYYAGMVRLLRGQAGANGLFQKCVEMKLVHYYEDSLAKGELARAGG